MIYVVGDLHIRKEEPFYSAADSVFEELYAVCNFGDIVIQLGDFFHTYKPFPKENSLAMKWLNKFEAKDVPVFILSGNNAHEYHHLQKTHAINPLSSFSNVTLIKDLTIFEVNGIKFFAIPWIPEEKIRKAGCETIEEYIGQFLAKTKDKADFLLYHYEDETVFMGGINHGIDFTFVEEAMPGIKRIGGHIHLQSKNYIGSPYQTRHDEINQTGRYYSIDSDKTIVSHSFKEYIIHKVIKFEDDAPTTSFDKTSFILTVEDAPSVDSVYDKFKAKNIFIRDIKLKFSESRQLAMSEDLQAESSLKELLQEYLTINKVDKSTSKYLQRLF